MSIRKGMKVRVIEGLRKGKIGIITEVDKRKTYPYCMTGTVSRFKESQLKKV